jgi:hypothetical protein
MDAQTFFTIKGILGAVGTALLLIHMNRSWRDFDKDCDGIGTGIGQRMRFLCMFGFAVLVTSASYEQIKDGVKVHPHNVGALLLAIALILTTVVSIIESERASHRRH